jgi:hypothetical protein
MTIMALMQEMGSDADLLTRNDEWLERERTSKAKELGRVVHELDTIQKAQNLKKLLQQKNLVPLQQIVRDQNGNVIDVIIKVMSAPDALSLLSAPRDDTDVMNSIMQFDAWKQDGYDLPGSAALR